MNESNNTCPCAESYFLSSSDNYDELTAAVSAALVDRFLQQTEDDETNSNTTTTTNDVEQQNGSLFQIIYTCFVLFLMFVALISDRVGADSTMMGALTLFMAANIVTIDEGLEGFANEGLLTVLVLFVVADGISKTGALDWYMSKLLGRPNTNASAQLRLM
jgi:di/tricarboxylate transporter